jgi:hypothetical protein
MAPGTWRMVHTIAQRMGIPFEEASQLRTTALSENALITGSTRCSSSRKGARSPLPCARPSRRNHSRRHGQKLLAKDAAGTSQNDPRRGHHRALRPRD